jgi:hypothetical protein
MGEREEEKDDEEEETAIGTCVAAVGEEGLDLSPCIGVLGTDEDDGEPGDEGRVLVVPSRPFLLS